MSFELNLSLTFIFLAFFLSKNNAKVLLSGYNTMSEAERKQVDIQHYLLYFKRFHLFLGISLLLLCVLLRRINDSAADVFMIIYPMLGYAFFMVKTEKFFKLSVIGKNFNRIIPGFLTCAAVAILYFSLISFKNSELVFENNQLEITGIYGIKVRKQEIEKIMLIDSLPVVTSKINGFNSSTFSKGNFTIKDGRHIKLFVNVNSGSYLFLKTVDGDVYYSSDQADMKDLYQKMLLWKGKGQSAK